jgi:hypothetical protein
MGGFAGDMISVSVMVGFPKVASQFASCVVSANLGTPCQRLI